MRAASDHLLATAEEYATRKRQHLRTQELCEAAGIGFEPVVFETAGGLEAGGRKILESILAEVAKVRGKPVNEVVDQVKARISLDLQRAQHRAIARRRQLEADQVVSGAVSRALLESDLEAIDANEA